MQSFNKFTAEYHHRKNPVIAMTYHHQDIPGALYLIIGSQFLNIVQYKEIWEYLFSAQQIWQDTVYF